MENPLREIRLKKFPGGLTEAARALGIDAGNLSRIERGIQAPRPELAKRIAIAYGISLDAVYRHEGGREKSRRKRRPR